MNWYRKIADSPIGEIKDISEDFKDHVDYDKYRFNSDDRNIINNSLAIENIRKRWEKVGPWINVYFLPIAGVFIKTDPKFQSQIEKLKDSDKITLIITNSQDHPTTAWMIAHRLSHALSNDVMSYSIYHWNEYFKTVESLYENDMNPHLNYLRDESHMNNFEKELLKGLLTMRSSKQGLTLRESFHELFAQYLITGKVKINHPPKTIVIQDSYYKRGIKHTLNENKFNKKIFIKDISPTLERDFQKVIDKVKGRILFDT